MADFERLAMMNAKGENCAVVYALLALAQQFERIAEVMEGALELAKRAEVEIHQNKPIPCNYMGGGSAGLDTADDFAMHCSKPDRHEGPHSYEEGDDEKS